MTCRRMPKESVRPSTRGGLSRGGDLLGHVRDRLAPGEIDIDMLGRDRDSGGDEPPK